MNTDDTFRSYEGLQADSSRWATNSTLRIFTLLEQVRIEERSKFLAVIAIRALTTAARSRADVKLCGKVARWVIDYSNMAFLSARRIQEMLREIEAERPVGTSEEDSVNSCQQTSIIRDLNGNPFQELHIDSEWLNWQDATVVKLAQAAYVAPKSFSGELESARLLVLADALEEAGCTNKAVFGHLRGSGPHWQGCHIVDRLLGND